MAVIISPALVTALAAPMPSADPSPEPPPIQRPKSLRDPSPDPEPPDPAPEPPPPEPAPTPAPSSSTPLEPVSDPPSEAEPESTPEPPRPAPADTITPPTEPAPTAVDTPPEPPPGPGTYLLVGGSVLGAASVAGIAIGLAAPYFDDRTTGRAVLTSMSLASLGGAAALVIVGARRRVRWRRWEDHQLTPGATVWPGGGSLSISGRF